jgi:hypothetical protein
MESNPKEKTVVIDMSVPGPYAKISVLATLRAATEGELGVDTLELQYIVTGAAVPTKIHRRWMIPKYLFMSSPLHGPALFNVFSEECLNEFREDYIRATGANGADQLSMALYKFKMENSI